jgi:hypothetical protein
MLRFFSALAATVFVVGTATADEKEYTLKLYQVKEGDVLKYSKSSDGNRKSTFSKGEQSKVDNEKSSSKKVYTETTITKPKDTPRATKLERVYETAEKVKDAKEGLIKLPYDGAKVLIEKKGEKYVFKLDGKEATGADVEDFDKDFNKKEGPKNEKLLPTKAVKVGDSWTVDNKKTIGEIVDFFADFVTIDAEKTSIKGKLLSVSQKNGATYGKLEFGVLPI